MGLENDLIGLYDRGQKLEVLGCCLKIGGLRNSKMYRDEFSNATHGSDVRCLTGSKVIISRLQRVKKSSCFKFPENCGILFFWSPLFSIYNKTFFYTTSR